MELRKLDSESAEALSTLVGRSCDYGPEGVALRVQVPKCLGFQGFRFSGFQVFRVLNLRVHVPNLEFLGLVSTSCIETLGPKYILMRYMDP